MGKRGWGMLFTQFGGKSVHHARVEIPPTVQDEPATVYGAALADPLAAGMPTTTNMPTTNCDAAALAAILDHLSLAILLVDRNFAVHYANAAARCGTGKDSARTVLEHTVCSSNHEAMRLRSAVADTCAKGTRRAVIVKGDLSNPILAMTVPFPGSTQNSHRALILIRDGIRVRGTLVSYLRSLFNLSLAEAEVAIAFGGGAAIDDVARERGVKRNTLRSQLASIMARTGTHRQGELAALVTRIDTLV